MRGIFPRLFQEISSVGHCPVSNAARMYSSSIITTEQKLKKKTLSDVNSRKLNGIMKGCYYRNGQQPWFNLQKRKKNDLDTLAEFSHLHVEISPLF